MTKNSLRRRIVTAYVMLALTLCCAFGTAVLIAIESIEVDLIEGRLERIAARVKDVRGLVQTQDLLDARVYFGAQIPPYLNHLPAGMHEIEHGSQALHVLMRGENEDRFAVVDDASNYEHIETDARLTVLATSGACLFLALLLGWLTASRVIAPLTALAKAVGAPESHRTLPYIDTADEIGLLSRAFTRRSDELHQFLAREQWFTGDVSHELRTPLMVMLGAAEVLAVQLSNQPESLEVVERIRRTAHETAERVSALLLLSRSPETLDAPPTWLQALVEAEIHKYTPLLAGKPVRIRLQADGDVLVHARAELVAMAVGNLVRNACQFTEQGEIRVTLNEHKLTVDDTGVGIPEALRLRIFERHVQASENSLSGSGLGLAIAQRIADHLGWQIHLEDRAAGGSRFTLTFPAPS
ncbi:MAG: sensor histidine kinase [Burkholderiaceae bacterium]